MVSFATVAGILLMMVLAGQGGAVRRDLGTLILLGLTAVMVFLPLGRYALESPDSTAIAWPPA